MQLAIMPMTQAGETRSIGGFRPETLLRVLEETNVSAFFDKWGPTEVLQVYNPETNMQGVLVIDNLAMGAGIGGIRISPTTTPRDVFLRARTMTLAAALVQVDFGGAAAGLRANPAEGDKIRLVRSFAKCISPHVPDQYIAAPDMGTGQEEMKAFAHEVGDLMGATGKPPEMGGIPYELGVVGFGMGLVTETYLRYSRPWEQVPSDLTDIKVAVQGFDNTGAALVKYLAHKGATIVAISDEWGGVQDPKGLDLAKVLKHSLAPNDRQSLAHFKGPARIQADAILKVDCDVLALTTACNLVNEQTCASVKAKCLVEGPACPVSPVAEQLLTRQGVVVLPDLLTLGGGLVSSRCEVQRQPRERAFSTIEFKVKDAATYVFQRASEAGLPLRRVASEVAKERILETIGG
jgi:glutamate dehydrogenase (NAD(P)+)